MSIILNEDQLNAVKQTEGPVRIIAGPGSGKTRTIISKISYILENNFAKSEEILVITFTNKAANEIKERINKEEGKYIKNVFTYHGWCNKFLRSEANAAGLTKDFIILDSNDVSKKISNLIKINKLIIDKSNVINAFDKISREEIYLNNLKKSKESALIQISFLWEKYNNEKKENGQLDFNDLISEVKNILIKNKEIANFWKNKYKYIFIDEFQDTNNIQFEIIKSITDSNSNITIVGDPDQNIYSWRGANINLINNFEKWYPKTKTIMLKINYRSTPEIISSSNSLIKNNKKRINSFFSKPFKDHGEVVEVIEKENDVDEAYSLIRRVKEFNNIGYKYHDIAIIIRSSYKTRLLESALNHYDIPYKVIGAMKFFDRREVKQVISFLKFSIVQSNSNFLEVINEPPKKFGPQKINKIRFFADEENLTMWEFLIKNKDNESNEVKDWIKNTKKLINSINKGDDPSLIFEDYLNDINYLNRLFDDPERILNIKETIKIISSSLKKDNNKNIKEKVINFINKIVLESSSDKKSENGQVNIITSHASKGTEFPIVFLFNMVEGHWPSKKSIENSEFEEERRVVYVAMTRAMDRLLITLNNGWNYNKETKSSRFINELLTIDSSNYLNSRISQELFSKHNLKLDNSIVKIGQKIFHLTFGKGEIILKNNEFIKVKFINGETQEILIGHQSYKIIKEND